MREGEGEKVAQIFKGLGIEVDVKEVKEDFFGALKGIQDPEDKRKAFRHAFYTCLGNAVRESGAKCLLQGTIAADILETKGGVKTQHNILEQIGIDPEERYGFKVIEPLRELYKHQVREVAKELGLPEEIMLNPPHVQPDEMQEWIQEIYRDWTPADDLAELAKENTRQKMLTAPSSVINTIDRGSLDSYFYDTRYFHKARELVLK